MTLTCLALPSTLQVRHLEYRPHHRIAHRGINNKLERLALDIAPHKRRRLVPYTGPEREGFIDEKRGFFYRGIFLFLVFHMGCDGQHVLERHGRAPDRRHSPLIDTLAPILTHHEQRAAWELHELDVILVACVSPALHTPHLAKDCV